MNMEIVPFDGRGKLAKKIIPTRGELTQKYFEEVASKLKGKKVLKESVTDSIQPGLRAIVRKTGTVSFHVSYHCGGERPLQKIGEYPEMSIAEARHLTDLIQRLAERGVDVRDGPRRERLVSELKEWGIKWRPNLRGPREQVLSVEMTEATLKGVANSTLHESDTSLILQDSKTAGLRAVTNSRQPTHFQFVYKDAAGKEHVASLGAYPEISVEEARKRAVQFAELVRKGVSLIEEDDC